ncbi:MAG TPA: CPBP family intramembrane metalloprotease [Spirochaetota bacterium]|nr:CPBP family intramembrane metalloprotease [Spirochaetota bacterium]HPI90866.1 CPBP family intramembrane metalloprotease [Spirochaetota bacterium]HPR48034.1 CPBP family intramembrane metalloprotease [Spirochaetota bacterium]
MNTQKKLLILFACGILPFELNGIYNPVIIKTPALFWSMEVLTWVIIPLLIFTCGIRKNFFTAHDLGINSSASRRLNKTTNIFLLVSLTVIVSTILPNAYDFFYHTADILFPVDYLRQNFSYHNTIPAQGNERMCAILFYSLTAGIVEELYYRGLFWKIIEKMKYRTVIYIISSSVIFSSVHWESGIKNLFATFLFGALCSLIFAKFKNLWPLIIGHVVTDFLLYIN